MNRSGRTTRMLTKALEAAGDHEVVPIMVHSETAIDPLKRIAWSLMHKWPDGKDRFFKLRFCRTGANLRGLPSKPIFVDNQWVASIQWILEVLKDAKETERNG